MIPLNDRDVTGEVLELKSSIDLYWKISRNTRSDISPASLRIFFRQSKNIQNAIKKTMKGRQLASLESAFKAVFGWDQVAWNSFVVSANKVHGVLIPSLLASIKTNEAEIVKGAIDTSTGEEVFTPITIALRGNLTTKLSAVEAEYIV